MLAIMKITMMTVTIIFSALDCLPALRNNEHLRDSPALLGKV